MAETSAGTGGDRRALPLPWETTPRIPLRVTIAALDRLSAAIFVLFIIALAASRSSSRSANGT